MPQLNFQYPMKGLNENYAATTQPSFTTPFLLNVRPYDVLENRARGGQRPGLLPMYQQILGYNYQDPTDCIALWHMDQNSIASANSIAGQIGSLDLTQGATGSITVFADGGGGTVTVTSNGHGLANGDTVIISGTTSYNGTFVVSSVAANTYKITDTWVANDATGTWYKTLETANSPFGGCLIFDGSVDHLVSDAADGTDLDIVADLTIVAWIKPADITGEKRIVSLFDDTGANAYVQYELWLDGSTLKGTVGTDTSTYTAYTAEIAGVVASQWQLVVMTVSGTTVQVYLNAVAGTSATTAGSRIAAGAGDKVTIGARYDDAAEDFFAGSICNVMIYDNDLDSDDVTALLSGVGQSVVDIRQIEFIEV